VRTQPCEIKDKGEKKAIIEHLDVAEYIPFHHRDDNAGHYWPVGGRNLSEDVYNWDEAPLIRTTFPDFMLNLWETFGNVPLLQKTAIPSDSLGA